MSAAGAEFRSRSGMGVGLGSGHGQPAGARSMHGADTVSRLLQQGREEHLADIGAGSYSTRSWGYWSQYRGSTLVLKIASAEGNAIRRGARACPAAVKQMYEPLLRLCTERAPTASDIPEYVSLTNMVETSPDVEPLREVLSATVSRVQTPDDWLPPDIMRRSTLRILARSVQLCPESQRWQYMLADGVAYGGRIESDPVFAEERRQAEAWRGVLLRHHSVGAWRALWSALVRRSASCSRPSQSRRASRLDSRSGWDWHRFCFC